MLTINRNLLLSLYGIIPIVLIIALTDTLVFDKYLLNHALPDMPAEWTLWLIIFNWPHIIASWITFADKAYIHHYKKVLSVHFPIVLVLVVILHHFMGGALAFIVFAVYTMYHVMSQQIGLAAVLMGIRQGRTFQVWRWLMIVCSLFIYANVYGAAYVTETANLEYSFEGIFQILSSITIVILIMLGHKLAKNAKNQLGVLYLWANVAMVLACHTLEIMEYSVFVIVIPRIIHDLTAFIVYITHDYNRNRDNTHNYIYRIFRVTRIPVIALCPLLAISSAYLIRENFNEVLEVMIISMTYMHYYFEGFIWKRNGVHRESIAFSSA